MPVRQKTMWRSVLGSGAWRCLAATVIVAVPAAALAISVVMLGQAIAEADKPLFGDWFNYRDAVSRVIAGEALYEPQQLTGPYFMPDTLKHGFSYPPAAVPWLIPFGWESLGIGAWTTVNVGVFVTGLWAALYKERGSGAIVPYAVALLGLILFLPFASGVISGNANVLMAGIYAWCWALGRSETRVGAIAGIGTVFKIFPTVLVLWPTGAARRRSIAIAAVVVAGSTLVSLPLVGWQAWLDYPNVLLNAQPVCADVRVSIPCAFTPIFGALGAKAIAVGVALMALLGALRVRNDRAAFVCFGVAMMAPVADMHLNYWLIAYVAIVVLLGGWRHPDRSRRIPPPHPVPPNTAITQRAVLSSSSGGTDGLG